ncbi:ATP-binding cassette subfamily B protein/ATP-binding cassette subfamily C protein CydCD [Stackebrandtia albiflava]|uniref:ATP-binding cassette subfamily B protein/ATP-binding cassette subfamily C protein CydCD n=1 Tax=Stackebrandtia albiflava TaxID=406432 RepID=A0A562UQ42_9ACTN|nr:ABC transporter ATP-binding protein [Stackebrandtia albiflava]TWJ07730.1 ATP-binding cassette subfamily B protein/ATP-binding cassette subfamily C protein CydCD [Stackebrandtia albiflava]
MNPTPDLHPTLPPGRTLASFAGLAQALKGWWPPYVFAVAMNVVSLCAATAAAALGALAVSTAVVGGDRDPSLHAIALLVAVGVVARGLSGWLESWVSHDLSFRMMARVRIWIFGALARAAPSVTARRRTGDLTTTAMTDAEALEIFYAHSSLYIVSAFVTTPVLIAATAVVSPSAAWAVTPVLLVAAGFSLAMRGAARRDGAEIRALIAAIGAEVDENIGAVREIVGYSMVEERLRRLSALDDALARVQSRNARRAGVESAAAGVVSVLATLVAAWVGVTQVNSSTLDPVFLPVLITLAGASSSAIVQWIGVTRHYGTTGEAARRIDEILSAPPPVDRSGTAVAPAGATAGVAAVGVSHSWPGVTADHPVTPALVNVDVEIAPGEHVALAGRSGAGKSTLGALVARFMDPDSGHLTVDGVGLTALSPRALTETVCLVPQEVHLFQESVRDNLRIATDRSPTDADLWEALETAHAAEIVRRMPDGLDTVIGERGDTLSGGERQRLALARAVLHGSRVLILDETVSQLDVVAERDVRDSLTRGTGDRTTIVIAHRLSTLLAADRIIVLDAGRVVGQGDHAALMRDCRQYADLVGPQLRALAPAAARHTGGEPRR